MASVRRRPTLGTLAALAAAAFAVWLFIELADDVMEGETRQFDESVLLAFREDADPEDPIGPRWVEEMARDVTALGGTVVLAFTTIAVTGFFLLQRKWHLATYVAAAVVTGVVASTLLKAGFDRPRPDLVDHGQVVYTASFPSGHSMLSVIAFLTLGALVAGAQKDRSMRLYILSLAAIVTVSVGISRVYLGVHWPSDVLGGWAAGTGWALTCWAVSQHLRRRGQIE
ncbi:MAG TPA: phosphatase PAP2 family protein [Steroidobacteraceae bacterium]|nr:phosphatase PAP2 family protein [Steroidobacteraceae bacterium]